MPNLPLLLQSASFSPLRGAGFINQLKDNMSISSRMRQAHKSDYKKDQRLRSTHPIKFHHSCKIGEVEKRFLNQEYIKAKEERRSTMFIPKYKVFMVPASIPVLGTLHLGHNQFKRQRKQIIAELMRSGMSRSIAEREFRALAVKQSVEADMK